MSRRKINVTVKKLVFHAKQSKAVQSRLSHTRSKLNILYPSKFRERSLTRTIWEAQVDGQSNYKILQCDCEKSACHLLCNILSITISMCNAFRGPVLTGASCILKINVHSALLAGPQKSAGPVAYAVLATEFCHSVLPGCKSFFRPRKNNRRAGVKAAEEARVANLRIQPPSPRAAVFAGYWHRCPRKGRLWSMAFGSLRANSNVESARRLCLRQK